MLHVRGETDLNIPCEEEKDACDLTRLKVTENGIYMPDEADGYYQVDVNVDGYPEPTGTINITQNGVTDVKDYANANVNVEGYPEPIGTVNITQNGTANVKDYASANVNVPNSYSASDEGKVVSNGVLVAQGSQTITQNGTYNTTLISELIANIEGGGGGEPIPFIVTASSTFSSSPKQPSEIFVDEPGYFWGSNGTNNWLNINFTIPIVLKKVRLSNYYRVSSSTYWYSSNITVRASNDGFTTYTDLYTGTGLAQSDTQFEIDLNNSTAYSQYRFLVSDSTAYAGLGRMTLEVSGGSSDDWTTLKKYIESSGTQYIDTGYSVKDNSKFEVIANPSTSQPTYATIFGTRSSNNDSASSHSCILATTWNSSSGNVNWGSGINRVTSLDKGNKTKYFVVKDRFVAALSESVNDVIGAGATGSTQSATTQPLFLFTLGANGVDYGTVTHCNMKLYRFRIYEDDTLVHEFIPWEDNGVACLKDTVTNELKYNAGSGVFTYGEDA